LAEKVGLSRLIDSRFAGMAMGIGTSKILGRVHAAKMEILGKQFICSLTVLEDNKVDFLFGLDNLKRHQCCIDLVQSLLHMRNGEISVPFLSEAEIKKNQFEEEKQHLIDQQKQMGIKMNENDIKELTDLGYTRAQVIEALSICDGNKEHAATYLLQQAGVSPKR
jgi:DNA damage-inducible protein 1